jgi:hypothetical protein
MFSASLEEILARYSDPSQNPYVQVRSQVRALPCLKKYTDILDFPDAQAEFVAASGANATSWTGRVLRRSFCQPVEVKMEARY